MNQAEIIKRFFHIKQKAESVGITLKVQDNYFLFHDVPGAQGKVMFVKLDDVDTFVNGYVYGYKSNDLPKL